MANFKNLLQNTHDPNVISIAIFPIQLKSRKFHFLDLATSDRQKFMSKLKGHRGIKSHQTLKLGIEDSEEFVDALLNPPKLNDALKAAALWSKRVMSREATELHTPPEN